MHEEILSYSHPMLLRINTPPKPSWRSDGFQVVYRFRNGYGASVVQHMNSYGGDMGKYELAVARWRSADDNDWEIYYGTDITNDVLGHLGSGDVHDILNQLGTLPPDAQALAGAVLD